MPLLTLNIQPMLVTPLKQTSNYVYMYVYITEPCVLSNSVVICRIIKQIIVNELSVLTGSNNTYYISVVIGSGYV